MRIIIFDVDGTLLDSQAIIVASFHEAFKENGLPMPDREKALSVVGLSLSLALEKVAQEMGVVEPPVEALTTSYKQAYRSFLQQSQSDVILYDGALECINTLHAYDDILLGIATGKSRIGLDRFLAAHQFERTFFVTKSADDALSKPHPQMLLDILRETGLRPQQAMMIGDTSFDISMACAADIEAVGVTWGFHPEEILINNGASFLAHDFEELTRYILS